LLRKAIFVVIAVAAAAAAGIAIAQKGVGGALAGITSQAVSTPSGPVEAKPKVEATPDSFKDLMAAINLSRSRAGLPALGWSSALAGEAQAAGDFVLANECSNTASVRVAPVHDVSVYWAPPIRSFDGVGRIQTLRPSFIVSEWRTWGDGFKPGDSCARAGDCASYGRIMKPAARLMGCAHVMCPNQAQIWTCRAGD
jgi:hypothetical protein